MADILGKVSTAVGMGLDKVAQSVGHKPVSDVDIYKNLKAQNFAGMVEKYGHLKTLAYIQTMEDKIKGANNG